MNTMQPTSSDPSPNLWKGLLTGALAGIAGSAAMALAGAALRPFSHKQDATIGRVASDTLRDADAQPLSANHKDSAHQATNRLAHSLAGRNLTGSEKTAYGTLFHFAFGAAGGALYGAFAEYVPLVTVGSGTLFGAAFFLGADEIAVPLTGLSQKPQQAPASAHLGALASHLLFGVVTENTRKLSRHG